MKKLSILLMALLFVAVLMCAHAEESRETFTSGDFEYVLLEDGTAEITRYRGETEKQKLEIPDALDGYEVTAIGDGVFQWYVNMASVTIPDSVTSIGDGVFSYCSSLTRMTIPDSVNELEANPFIRCDTLKSIIVSPDHPALATIDGVLFGKAEKKLICYPCAFLATEYEIPKGIEIIGDRSFYGCKSLTDVTIPDSVTSIGDYAFSSCSSLTDVTIPRSVTEMGKNPFEHCDTLKSIIVSPDHPTLETIDGVLFGKAEKKLICYPCALTASEYEIPQGIEIIGDYAFATCSNLTGVTIPDSVTSIGESAFSWCRSLTRVTVPDSVTFISDKAFFCCKNLTLTVPRDSYAKTYCEENSLPYTYPDANDWLNG